MLDISLTGRLLNLIVSNDGSDLTNETFRYVIREYYVLIWAFLFKHDYAFKVV